MMADLLLHGPKDDSTIPRISMGVFIFQQLKQKDPNEIAVVDAFTRDHVTYGQILRESVQAAIALQNRGIKVGDKVAITSENFVRFCIPYLATLYTGAVLCPSNPTFVKRELNNVFDLTKPKIVFVSNSCLKTVLQVRNRIDYEQEVIALGEAVDGTVAYQDFLKVNDEAVEKFKPVNVNVDTLQLILLSSGTTGVAKAVMLTHRNLRLMLYYLQDDRYAGMGIGEATLGLAPCFHSLGLFSQLAAITFSAKLIVMAAFKPDVFLKSIQDHKITRLFVVPPIVTFLAKHPMVSNFDLSSLKEIFCTGAPLGQDVLTLFQKRLKGVLRQAYGLTELTGIVTGQEKNCPKLGTVGRLLPGVTAKVADVDTGKLVGVNQRGELLLKGDMVTPGYYRDEESTKMTFDQEGFLRTGDVGYYDEDGDIFIVDRLKELIKYKGFQVAPAEIEDILVSHPSVKEAGVVGKSDERAGEVPLAFVVKQPNAEVTEQELIDYVAERIAEQKRLYGGVIFIEELPKMQSGKILRRKLRELIPSKI